MSVDFDYASYGELLDRLVETNVGIGFAGAVDPPERYFILRHDVDFSPDSAVRMAEFEARRGVRSTYFLLPNASHYNLLEPEHCTLPRRLVELGHEVGLHYDLATFEAVAPELRHRLLRLQADLVGTLSTAPVRAISMHNPSRSGEDPFRNGSGFLSAYDDRFTREIAYVSDSCGAWRDEAVALLTTGLVPPRLQLLVHPLFWEEVGRDRWDVLDRFVENGVRVVNERGKSIRACWLAHTGVIEHDRRTSALEGLPDQHQG